jgi:DNA invertase Pin-like site-specific DNA recombinase
MQLKDCIALYIRLSEDDDNIDGETKSESNSVTAQRNLLTEFVEQQKEFVDIPCVEYVDDGYSGTNFQRPSFKRMMEDAKCGRISIIVIKDFSRFGRDYLEVGSYLEKILPLLGVRLLSVNDGFDSYNCSGTTGGMSIALKNMLNAMYSKDLSKKVRTAMATHARNGEYVSSRATYGYIKDPADKHQLVIDPEAAEIVRLIFTMAADGKNKGQIALYLNENKVMTCREYFKTRNITIGGEDTKEKKLWSTSTIADILKNEIYLGKTIWNKGRIDVVGGKKMVKNDRKDWIVIEGTHEQIVSEELFAKANQMAFTNRKRNYKTRGKNCAILMCPACGRNLSLTGSNTAYRCPRAHTSGIPECSNSKMKKIELEETVLTCARNMVKFISENLEMKKKEWADSSMMAEKIGTLEGERKRLSARKIKLYSDYRTGAITREKYVKERDMLVERINEIERRIPEIENEIEESKKRLEEAGEKQTVLNEIAALQDFDKEVLHKIVDTVNVYGGGRIEIIWRMDDIFFTGDRHEIIEVRKEKE